MLNSQVQTPNLSASISPAMRSFQHRLRSLESDFLAALVKGGETLSDFNDRWDVLADELASAADAGTLDSETTLLAHSTALRLAMLADTSVDLYDSYNTITAELMCEVDTLMSQLTLYDSPCLSDRGCDGFDNSQSRPHRDDLEKSSIRGSMSRKRSIDTPSNHNGVRSKRQRTVSPIVCFYDQDGRRPKSRLDSAPPGFQTVECSRGAAVLPSDPPVRTSRKRRLSESCVTPAPTTSKRVYFGPRLHAVSDSFVAHSRSSVNQPTSIEAPVWSAKSLCSNEQLDNREEGEWLLTSPRNTPSNYVQLGPASEADFLGWSTIPEIVDPHPSELSELDDFLRSLLDPIATTPCSLLESPSSVRSSGHPTPSPQLSSPNSTSSPLSYSCPGTPTMHLSIMPPVDHHKPHLDLGGSNFNDSEHCPHEGLSKLDNDIASFYPDSYLGLGHGTESPRWAESSLAWLSFPISSMVVPDFDNFHPGDGFDPAVSIRHVSWCESSP